MGSASREALAQARQALRDGIAPSAGVELLQAAAQIDASPALGSVLGDASTSDERKTQVVTRLFGSYSADARGLLTAAVSGRWSNVAEFVSGVEELGIRVVAHGTDSLSEELLAVADVIDSNHELELNLGSKLGDPAAKVALVRRLFGDKAAQTTVDAVAYVAANLRGRRFDAVLRAAARTAADENGSELATVTTAAPLAPAQADRLASILAQSVGRPVRVSTVIDPTLIGGIRIELADDVIDGSVRARLDDLRQKLAA